MSWLVIAIIAIAVLRVTRRSRWRRRALRARYGQFPPWADRSWRAGIGRPGERAPLPAPAPSPNPQRDLERTIAAVRDAYVAGRITVEEYERKLDELYRTAEGKRLREP
ncbi:MAG: DUF1707 domain-containing protein [Gemmatimonadetes bacterium]|nr:DUF1707 domain-containing protein [Gemmatimonadota bacterium]